MSTVVPEIDKCENASACKRMAVKIQFAKMSGAGNDFVVADNRSGKIKDASSLAKKLCDRRWGIGADGLLLVEASSVADFRMMYYNADGSYGGMCGNGGRCIARYAVDAGIAGPKQSFEALGYTYHARVNPEQVVLSMKDPVDFRTNIVLRITSQQIKGHFVNTGSPHVVIPVPQRSARHRSIEKTPVDQVGREIRFHRLFQPEGANVNFVQRNKDNSIRMRTYERGVEAETLACGTGSVASAIIGSILWKLPSPITIIASSGMKLIVGFKRDGGEFSNVTLTGPAIETFRGEVDV